MNRRTPQSITLPRHHLIAETPDGYWLFGTFEGEPPDTLRPVVMHTLQGRFSATFWERKGLWFGLPDLPGWQGGARPLSEAAISDIIEDAAVKQGFDILGQKRR